MDNFIKITMGWVRQYYERNEDGVFVCTGQEFEVGDLCEFADDGGCPLDPQEHQYYPYEMQQPNENKSFCESCGRRDCIDVEWREETEQYECEECYQAWRKENGL